VTAPRARVTAVVPAAGASRRFGSAKLLALIAGEPLLQHTLRALLDGGVSNVVLVVAPGHGLDAVPLLHDPRVHVTVNPDPARGMFSSIQTGLAAVASGHAVLVLPADMPFVRASTVAEVVAAHARDANTVVAAYDGRRGHPVIVSADVWPTLIALPPQTNLKAALLELGTVFREVSVDDPGVLRDVDVREDLG
jgi:molybdenum cofactor cytidylyltransferase